MAALTQKTILRASSIAPYRRVAICLEVDLENSAKGLAAHDNAVTDMPLKAMTDSNCSRMPLVNLNGDNENPSDRVLLFRRAKVYGFSRLMNSGRKVIVFYVLVCVFLLGSEMSYFAVAALPCNGG